MQDHLIVALQRHNEGREVLELFWHREPCSLVCVGCGRQDKETLTPVEELHDDDGSVSTTGGSLCLDCTTRLPGLRAYIRDAWPAPLLLPSEIGELWLLVAKEKAFKRDRDKARAAAPKTSLQSVEALLASAQVAKANERREASMGKVA
jgi:hypothetical protein